MSQYYFLIVGHEDSQGPFTSEELLIKTQNLDPEQFYFWHEGMSSWEIALNCSDYKALMAPAETESLTPPLFDELPTASAVVTEVLHSALPEPAVTISEAPLVSNEPLVKSEPRFSPYSAEDLQRREQIKFPLKFNIIIKNADRAFVSSTRNISLTGALLAQPFPEGLQGPACEVFLIDRKKHLGLTFKCEIHANDQSKSILSFKIDDFGTKANLAKWLDEQIHFVATSA